MFSTFRIIAVRTLVAILLCVVTPILIVNYIIEHLELTWWNIFMVSGVESIWVYLSWDMSRWIKQAWDER